MSPFEAYSYLFMDSLMASLLFPMHTELVLPAMRIFGGYDKLWVTALPVLAMAVATIVNWWLGKIFTYISRTNRTHVNTGGYSKLLSLLRRYGKWWLVCAPIPVVGSVLSVGAGFIGIRLWQVVGLAVVGKVVVLLVV